MDGMTINHIVSIDHGSCRVILSPIGHVTTGYHRASTSTSVSEVFPATGHGQCDEPQEGDADPDNRFPYL